MQVGVDTGGTFTDLVAADGRVAKVLSTPDDPAQAIRTVVGTATGAAAGSGGTTSTGDNGATGGTAET